MVQLKKLEKIHKMKLKELEVKNMAKNANMNKRNKIINKTKKKGVWKKINKIDHLAIKVNIEERENLYKFSPGKKRRGITAYKIHTKKKKI